MKMNDPEVRAEVVARLRRADHRAEDWQLEKMAANNAFTVDEEEYGSLSQARETAVRDAVGAWLAYYENAPATVRRTEHGTSRPDGPKHLAALRGRALSKLSAADAAKHPGVVAFRAEHLAGQLLPAGEEADQACLDWITERGPEYYGRLMGARFVADEPDTDRHPRMPEPLRELYLLSEEIGKKYSWIKGAATMFVLTGQEPEVFPLRASGRITYNWLPASRITLVIDPWVSPDEVRDLYHHVRKSDSYFGADANLRPQLEKALLLAEFSITCTDDESGTEQVQRWNTEHPEHAYPDGVRVAGNFRRDMRQAVDRLLNPKLGHIGRALNGR